jgi:hypothetical protein
MFLHIIQYQKPLILINIQHIIAIEALLCEESDSMRMERTSVARRLTIRQNVAQINYGMNEVKQHERTDRAPDRRNYKKAALEDR